MDRKRQGDLGVAAAIFYYTRKGFTVCQPLTDAARYDLVVDDGRQMLRVQCKTTGYSRSSVFEVQLATKGGNRSGAGVTKALSDEECDRVFIYCMDATQYEFPIDVLHGRATLKLGKKHQAYRV